MDDNLYWGHWTVNYTGNQVILFIFKNVGYLLINNFDLLVQNLFKHSN